MQFPLFVFLQLFRILIIQLTRLTFSLRRLTWNLNTCLRTWSHRSLLLSESELPHYSDIRLVPQTTPNALWAESGGFFLGSHRFALQSPLPSCQAPAGEATRLTRPVGHFEKNALTVKGEEIVRRACAIQCDSLDKQPRGSSARSVDESARLCIHYRRSEIMGPQRHGSGLHMARSGRLFGPTLRPTGVCLPVCPPHTSPLLCPVLKVFNRSFNYI